MLHARNTVPASPQENPEDAGLSRAQRRETASSPRRRCLFRLSIALVGIGSLLNLAAQAPGKSGVSPSVISLPGGPGAIEGLGPSFEPHLNTGTATYGVPIAVPPGVAGHQPELALSYNSGSGNGFLGIGWSLDLPQIQRQVDKGLPRYTGAGEPAATEDAFLFGGEELVPLSDGTYRCENETEFTRFRKVASQPGGPVDAWEASLPGGGVMIFGAGPGERVTRPGGDPASFADTYCWAISTHSDTSGNEIRYEYQTFTPDSAGLLYPRRIEYARFGPSIHHRLEFAYSGSERFPEQRTDVFSDFRSGFEIRTSRLLREIAVYTDGQLVRRYVLGYTPDPTLRPPSEGVDLGFSQVQSVTQFDRTGGDANYLPPLRFAYTRFNTVSGGTTSGLPEIKPVTGGVNFLRFGPTWTEATDINSDGLPDFVSSALGSWYAYLNRGQGQFSDEVPFTANSADGTDQANGKRLDEAAITLADLDGDGITDLFQKAASSERMLMHRNLNDFRAPSTLDATEVVRWGPEIEFSAELETVQFGTLDISAPSIRMLDLNFDKRTDVMRPFDFGDGTGGIEYIVNLPDGWQSDLALPTDPRIPADWSPDEARFDGQNPAWRVTGLADLNGDRLEDWYTLAIVGDQVWLDYWPNANGGYWAPRHATERLTEPGARADEFRLMDINADGLNDLVLVRHLILKFWVNTGSDQWSDAIVRTDAPVYMQGFTVLRMLDVNGNGTPDLFWDNSLLDPTSLPAGAPVYAYLDFVGDLKPNLLTVIDNGIGLQTHISYRSSSQDYLQALAEGHPWTTKLPFPVTVVGRMVENVGLDLNADGRVDEYITDITYRDGYYDSFEKEFRGFAFVQEIERGDDYNPTTGATGLGTGTVSGPTLVSRHRYLTGTPDGVDNDDYVDGYVGPVATDEGTGTGGSVVSFTDDRGGREEEALKGFTVVQETIDGAILNAPPDEAAGFHACARAAALAALADPLDPDAFRCAPEKYVYTRSRTDWKVRRLYRPQNVSNPPGRFADGDDPQPCYSLVEKSVSFAYATATETEVIEANGLLRQRLDGNPVGYPERSPKTTRSESRYDDYGNSVFAAECGIVEPGDVSAYDDERITRTTYALDGSALSRWLIRFPTKARIEDENGIFVSETRYFYDGQELVGLPLGELGTRGLLKRTESVVTDDPGDLVPLEDYARGGIDRPGDPRLTAGSFIVASRTAHDVYGNPIVLMGPLGDPSGLQLLPSASEPLSAEPMAGNAGHFRIIEYDGKRHTYPVTETVVIGDGKVDPAMQAEYDPGLGVVTEALDWNTNRTSFHYDSFGRLVKIVRPGDSEERPTRRFVYRPGDSQRNLVYEYSEEGTLIGGAPVEAVPPVASAVETRQREDLSESPEVNTFNAIQYSSGSGQSLISLTEGEEPGQWVVTQALTYNQRGAQASAYTPYYRGNSDLHTPGEEGIRYDGNAVSDTDRVETQHDATGRTVLVVNPPEAVGGGRSFALVQNLPFEKRDFDPEDANPTSESFESPHLYFNDGLQRLIEVHEITRLNDDGTPGGELRTWITRYDYDLNNKLLWMQDSQGNVTWSRFDSLGREIFRNHPDQGPTWRRFDDASKLIEIVDAKQQRSTFTYDGANRPLTEDYHDEGLPFSANRAYDPSQPIGAGNQPDVAYYYDMPDGAVDLGNGRAETPTQTLGRLWKVIDLAGEFYGSFDARGRAKWEVRRIPDPFNGTPVSYCTALTYDASDRVVEHLYPDGDRIRYEYNSRSLPEQITGGSASNAERNPFIVSRTDYVPAGKIDRFQLGNGLTTQHTFDPRQRLRSLIVASEQSPDDPLLGYEYQYDSTANLLRIDDLRQAGQDPSRPFLRNTQVFTYDDLHRLTSVHYPAESSEPDPPEAGEIRYRYDRIGNMLAKTSNIEHREEGLSVTDLGEMTCGDSAGRANRIGRNTPEAGPHALSRTASGHTLGYDANGSVTQLNGLTCTWDFLDRLVAVEKASARAEYAYDFQGRRTVRRIYRAVETGGFEERPASFDLFVNPHFEVRDRDQPVKFVWHGDRRVARVTGTLDPDAARVQRLRLWEGWNLVSIAVTAADGLAQLTAGAGSTIRAVYRWSPVDNTYVNLSETAGLSAGDVLWIFAFAPTVAQVEGIYRDVADTLLLPGARYIGLGGLESQATPEAFVSAGLHYWVFDARSRQWLHDQSGALMELDVPQFLSPGVTLFVCPSEVMEIPTRLPRHRIHYYIQDHLNSANLLTDAAGNILEETVFYPFGHPRSTLSQATALGLLPSQYVFSQKEHDAESGLDYFEARFLIAFMGRFNRVDPASEDPRAEDLLNPQFLHPYVYAGNNPCKYLDPDGAQIATAIGIVTGAAAGAIVHTVRYFTSKDYAARTCIKGGFRGQLAKSAGYGALTGAAAGLVIDTAGAFAVGGLGVAAFMATPAAGTLIGSGVAGGAVGGGITGYRVYKKTGDWKKAALAGGIVFTAGAVLGVGGGALASAASGGLSVGAAIGVELGIEGGAALAEEGVAGVAEHLTRKPLTRPHATAVLILTHAKRPLAERVFGERDFHSRVPLGGIARQAPRPRPVGRFTLLQRAAR